MAVSLGWVFLTEDRQAHAALVLLDQFNSGLGTPVSCGFDSTTDGVWVYGASDATLSRFTRAGGLLGTIARPGESADDVDISVAPAALTLGSTPVAAGTPLFVNGESGVAEVYAVDKGTGAILASLTTGFGLGHVVGGAYHPGRGTFFLVQDRQPSGTANDSVVAEVDPGDGSVINTFRITLVLSTFTVNFGDIEVGANGNLFVASSDESTIAEFSPAGAFVQELALPSGVSSLSGIGFDNGRGEAWVSGTNGTVWRLGGFPVTPLGLPQLSVSKEPGNGPSLLTWPQVPGATGYDVIRGDLGILRQSGGDFAAGTVACVANDAVAVPVPDPASLGTGEVRWYLVRAVNAGNSGSYDSGGTGQQGARDLEIAASGFACP